jgi:hypothetical protein
VLTRFAIVQAQIGGPDVYYDTDSTEPIFPFMCASFCAANPGKWMLRLYFGQGAQCLHDRDHSKQAREFALILDPSRRSRRLQSAQQCWRRGIDPTDLALWSAMYPDDEAKRKRIDERVLKFQLGFHSAHSTRCTQGSAIFFLRVLRKLPWVLLSDQKVPPPC